MREKPMGQNNTILRPNNSQRFFYQKDSDPSRMIVPGKREKNKELLVESRMYGMVYASLIYTRNKTYRETLQAREFFIKIYFTGEKTSVSCFALDQTWTLNKAIHYGDYSSCVPIQAAILPAFDPPINWLNVGTTLFSRDG